MGPSRQKILDTVPVTGSGVLTIDSVALRCNVSYSTARVHLRELRKAGLVHSRRANRRDFYSR